MAMLGLAATFFFLFSVLFVLILILWAIYLAARRRWNRLIRPVSILGTYLFLYGVVLAAVGLATPRRTLDAGQPECFDEWCVTGVSLAPASGDRTGVCPSAGDETMWVAALEVSSQTRRVRQRELGVQALLEDSAGQRYTVCTGPLPDAAGSVHGLSDPLDPGEHFQVELAYTIPQGATPAGLVISHGWAPGKFIIGDDESLFHKETLLKMRH